MSNSELSQDVKFIFTSSFISQGAPGDLKIGSTNRASNSVLDLQVFGLFGTWQCTSHGFVSFRLHSTILYLAHTLEVQTPSVQI